MKRYICIFLVAAVVINAAFDAAKAGDTKEQYRELQEKIDAEQEKLKKAKKHEHSILDDLEKLNRELSGTEQALRKCRGSLEKTKREIAVTKAEIASIEEKLKKQRNWIKRKLRAMHKYGAYKDVISVISTSESLSQLLRRWRYLEALTRHEQGIIENHKKDLDVLNEKNARLDDLYAKLKKDENKVSLAEKDLSSKKSGKENYLASVKGERASYEKMLRELKESSARLLEIIRKSEQETETAYKGEGFRTLKGSLIWPVAGQVAIPYGAHKDPKFNTPVFRNGIYIKTESESAAAKAVYKGKVIYADWFKGYGQLVIINHGEGYNTLYANLSEIFLKVGDIIKETTAVGRVGESSAVSAHSLYFEVRYKGKPLDPVQWLRRR